MGTTAGARAGLDVLLTDERAPVTGDRRFADPAWDLNGLLRRVLHAYLAAGEARARAASQRNARDTRMRAACSLICSSAATRTYGSSSRTRSCSASR